MCRWAKIGEGGSIKRAVEKEKESNNLARLFEHDGYNNYKVLITNECLAGVNNIS